MRRNYRYGESWNDLHTELSAVSFFVGYTIYEYNAVYDLKFLRAKTVMITVKSVSRDQLSISLFNFDMVLLFLLLYYRLCTV